MANLLKGGKAVYKTTQATSAAVRAVDIYKTSQKSFDALKISQKGLYGLTATNGFSEAITGRDMFGNYTYTTDHYGRIVKVEASDLKYGE
ncbi:hypothetical protein ABD83_15425, partial [Bacillus xiamenensis]|nr:hypothetical protein [Bacillus xiamenensis]MBG9912798.1 hypothetical protein [Bacillus xiamenensis]